MQLGELYWVWLPHLEVKLVQVLAITELDEVYVMEQLPGSETWRYNGTPIPLDQTTDWVLTDADAIGLGAVRRDVA